MANAVETDVPRVSNYNDFTAPDNKSGLPMKVMATADAIVSHLTIPDHMAGWRSEDTVGAHPGAIDTVLTTVMGQGTFYRFRQAAFIKSLSVEYFGLVPVGRPLNCRMRAIRRRGDQEVVVEAEIVDEQENVLAQASGNYQLIDVGQLRAPNSLISNQLAACNVAFLNEFEGLAQSIT